MSNYIGGMTTLYRTEGVNDHGGDGTSWITGGLEVQVASPLAGGAATADTPEQTNPEQLLALAWATCLNATVQAILERSRRSRVRVTVGLHEADPGPGYEFHVDAYVGIAGAEQSDAEETLQAAHARCPMSKLLRNAATVQVHVEPYTP